jgi:hypothetical protein
VMRQSAGARRLQGWLHLPSRKCGRRDWLILGSWDS